MYRTLGPLVAFRSIRVNVKLVHEGRVLEMYNKVIDVAFGVGVQISDIKYRLLKTNVPDKLFKTGLRWKSEGWLVADKGKTLRRVIGGSAAPGALVNRLCIVFFAMLPCHLGSQL